MSLFDGYDKQSGITNRLPLPVDVVADTAYKQSITGESLQLYYWNSDVLTVDAGQAAGTVVIAKFAYSGILDKLGAMIGNSKDTSIVFSTGTVLTTEVACDYSLIEAADNATLKQIATDLTANMSNGQYCVDYRNGVLYGKKATTATSDVVAYSVSTQTTGGGTTITDSVNIAKILNVAVPLDDAAFSVGAHPVLPQGMLADETATDSVDEGDVGMPRMTLTRKQITASEFQEDTAHTTGDYGTQILAVRDDTAATVKAGTDGDYIPLTTDNVGHLRSTLRSYDTASGANKDINIAPSEQQYTEETLIDTTNVGAATNYYPSSSGLLMAGYKDISIQGQISGGVTATIEVTNDDAASPDWIDITDSLYNWTTGGTRYATSWVDTNFLFQLDNLNFKAIRIKSITSDATNAVQYNVRRKAL